MDDEVSVSDEDSARFERIAARHSLSLSEFYYLAAQRFADHLDGTAGLTELADAVIDRAGQPSEDGLFLRESQRIKKHGAP